MTSATQEEKKNATSGPTRKSAARILPWSASSATWHLDDLCVLAIGLLGLIAVAVAVLWG